MTRGLVGIPYVDMPNPGSPAAFLMERASYVRRAKKPLVPEIIRRRERGSSDTKRESKNLLSWIMETTDPDESDPSDSAHLKVVML